VTAYAPEFTFRYWLKYSSLGDEHEMMWRFPSSTGAGALFTISTKFTQFLDAIAGMRFTDWAILSARYSLANSLISLPASPLPTPVAGTAALPVGAAAIAQARPVEHGWRARTLFGQPWGFYVFGLGTSFLAGNGNFRLTPAEFAAVTTSIAALNGGSIANVGNDDAGLSWYEYINQKDNDYWVHQVRG